jgi:hypothetical protein
VHAQRARCTGFPVNVADKVQGVLAGCRYAALQKKFNPLRMLVPPPLHADTDPKLRFVRTGKAHPNIAAEFCRGLLDRTMENTADLDQPVTAGTQQIECASTREGADFVQDRSPAVHEESLDPAQ